MIIDLLLMSISLVISYNIIQTIAQHIYIINKQTNKQIIMSKITTLLILLIAAATSSSSSSASNSSIESKAEDNSVAKSSLIIDKSSGKPNNKDWSFEEFENTMEVRLLYVMSRPNLFV